MKRLLIFELHLLGDAVMSLPFLRTAQKNYEVHLCCSPAAAKLYELVVPAERLHRLELPSRDRRSLRSLWGFFQKLVALRNIRAEVALTVWADARVQLLMRLLGISERVSFPMNEVNYYAHHVEWRRRNLRRGERIQKTCRALGFPLLTTSCERADYQQHHVEDWRQLAAGLGLSLDLDSPWLAAKNFVLPEAAVSFFQRQAGRKVWMLHPGAARDTKRWPHFQALVRDFFAQRDLPLVILEDPAVARIQPTHQNCLCWPMSTLADFIALTAACDFVLCNDSAASHVGAALKKHVVTIFGSGSSAWFAPYATAHTVIESSVCPYRPCFDRCLQPSIICLEGISLARVMATLEKLD